MQCQVLTQVPKRLQKLTCHVYYDVYEDKPRTLLILLANMNCYVNDLELCMFPSDIDTYKKNICDIIKSRKFCKLVLADSTFCKLDATAQRAQRKKLKTAIDLIKRTCLENGVTLELNFKSQIFR